MFGAAVGHELFGYQYMCRDITQNFVKPTLPDFLQLPHGFNPAHISINWLGEIFYHCWLFEWVPPF